LRQTQGTHVAQVDTASRAGDGGCGFLVTRSVSFGAATISHGELPGTRKTPAFVVSRRGAVTQRKTNPLRENENPGNPDVLFSFPGDCAISKKLERGGQLCPQVTISPESTRGPSLTLRVFIENSTDPEKREDLKCPTDQRSDSGRFPVPPAKPFNPYPRNNRSTGYGSLRPSQPTPSVAGHRP
jgi:hypothetical protein